MLASPGEESTLWWKSVLADMEEDTWWSKSGEVGVEEELPHSSGMEEIRKQGDEPMMERELGRLPGRTANDVKNYWNSHPSRRLSMQKGKQFQIKSMRPTTAVTTKIIRPQPRTFSPNSKWLNGGGSSIVEAQLQKMSNNAMPASPRDQESTLWWKSLLADMEDNTWRSKSGEVGVEEELPHSFEVEEMERMKKEGDKLMMEGGLGEWDDMLLDVDLWGLVET
ncbi:transcription factor MYB1 [Cinnamomum micranthum f. kanehirae]|uniref:Transcription factor MYB1 n=1 Tax=Cinnamomum micranthum f. kanehirae TaxID=337451 RepID=A0A443N930_9MAGN|nr:transcription factor MYB1 [Cinnamomum micranthum f. kanehirae]